MSGWQLEPAGIGKILTVTGSHVEAIGGALSTVATDVGEPLATGAGFDGVVVQALAGFFEEQSAARLGPLLSRYNAALEATAGATNAFLAGDEQMAASTVAAAGAAVSGDVSVLSGRG